MNLEAIAKVAIMIGKSIPMISIEATLAETIINIIKKEAPDVQVAILQIQDGAVNAESLRSALSAQIRAEIAAGGSVPK